jgi:uncharacterized repeat protein (TIGR03803 family)
MPNTSWSTRLLLVTLLAGACFAGPVRAAENPVVIHEFSGYGDGSRPWGGLINVLGTLYGTTYFGGSMAKCDYTIFSDGCGTVFKITPAGTETVLYTFPTQPNGESQGFLSFMLGKLYGTTPGAGSGARSGDDGTIFSMSLQGAQSTLYSFQGTEAEPTDPRDGAGAIGSLIDVGGQLVGTTGWGGIRGCASIIGEIGCGIVFTSSFSGQEKVLYRFKTGTDGYYPNPGLVKIGGWLYGTTRYGGANGFGTIFRVALNGVEQVVYSFQGGNDGRFPVGSLVDVGGKLYGMTSGLYGNPLWTAGVAGTCSGTNNGSGSFFSVTPSGVFTKLTTIPCNNAKGPLFPNGLIYAQGTFYGTSFRGGAYGYEGSQANGDGTLFSITPGGTLTVLYSFGDKPSDGINPTAAPTYLGGALYGTTVSGGNTSYDGTVYRYLLP